MRIRTSAVRVGRVGACVLLTGGAMLLIALQPSPSVGQAPPPAGASKPGFADDFAKLGFKFEGATTCNNAKCHGADEPKEGAGATTLAEFTQWSAEDPHNAAYKQLEEDKGVEIAGAMKPPIDPKSDRCLDCHSTNAPEKPKNLRGNKFALDEGVSCNACHGPSEKWNSPHGTKGWTAKQRTATKTHDALLKATGLFDTKSVVARADMCTSCHLALPADMAAAGHPEPSFELDFYSTADPVGYYKSQHWREPTTPFYHTTLWATGQAVALRDAMAQLAQRAGAKAPDAKAVTSAWNKAMAHYSVFKPVLASGVVKGDAKAWDAHAAKITAGAKAKKWADVAAGAKAISAEAAKVAPAAGVAKFDKAKTIKIAQDLLKDPAYKTYGAVGIEQQGYAILALYSSAYPSKAEGDAGATGRQAIMDNLLFPAEGEMDATKFAAGLKKITPQIK